MTDDRTDGAYYIIHIREKLDERWREWFEGMSIRPQGDGTALAGFLPDQAALHGMIGRVQRLGLYLIAINQGELPGYRHDNEMLINCEYEQEGDAICEKFSSGFSGPSAG